MTSIRPNASINTGNTGSAFTRVLRYIRDSTPVGGHSGATKAAVTQAAVTQALHYASEAGIGRTRASAHIITAPLLFAATCLPLLSAPAGLLLSAAAWMSTTLSGVFACDALLKESKAHGIVEAIMPECDEPQS